MTGSVAMLLCAAPFAAQVLIMGYTLEQLTDDCRTALRGQEMVAARRAIQGYCSRACNDDTFIAAHFGLDNTATRRILYEDPEFGFCVLSHVYTEVGESRPHDHGPSWAIYAQVAGRTEMTDWRVIRVAADDAPAIVEPVRTYVITRGDAHVYHEGDIHSPRRDGPTKLIRIEGMKLDGVARGYFVPAIPPHDETLA